MSGTDMQSQTDPLVATIIQHRMGDGTRGDYEVAPYRKLIYCVGCDWDHDIAGMSGWRSWVAKHAEHIAEEYEKATAAERQNTIVITKPQIHTGPKQMTVDEATTHYLTEAAERVRANRYWGSGVTALVSGILDDVATTIAAERLTP